MSDNSKKIIVVIICLFLIIKLTIDVSNMSRMSEEAADSQSRFIEHAVEAIKAETNERGSIGLGLSPEEVIKIKGNKTPKISRNTLIYKDETWPYIKDIVASNYKCTAYYVFDNNQLISVCYSMNLTYAGVLDFIGDYNDIKKYSRSNMVFQMNIKKNGKKKRQAKIIPKL